MEDHENGATATTSTSAANTISSTITGTMTSAMTGTTRTTAGGDRQDVAAASVSTTQPKKKKAVCQFHPGRVFNKVVFLVLLFYQSPLVSLSD